MLSAAPCFEKISQGRMDGEGERERERRWKARENCLTKLLVPMTWRELTQKTMPDRCCLSSRLATQMEKTTFSSSPMKPTPYFSLMRFCCVCYRRNSECINRLPFRLAFFPTGEISLVWEKCATFLSPPTGAQLSGVRRTQLEVIYGDGGRDKRRKTRWASFELPRGSGKHQLWSR